MKPLMFILVTLGLVIGNAHAQSDKLVLGGDTNEFNDVRSCDRCVELEGYSDYSNKCPTEANALLRYGYLSDQQQLEKNWVVSELWFHGRALDLDLLTFEFGDMSMSPGDVQKTICLLGTGIEVEQVADLNNDGFSEVIITHIAGGARSAWAYHLVALDKFGGLKVYGFPEQNDYSGPEILRENNKTLIAIDRFIHSGPELDKKIFFYEFNGKELWIKRWSEPPYLQALKEAHLLEFLHIWRQDEFRELEIMQFDLNGDGEVEYVYCDYEWRWIRMRCDIRGEKINDHLGMGCIRLGILPTKSNQWHDLVCDYNTRFRFDGAGYYTE